MFWVIVIALSLCSVVCVLDGLEQNHRPRNWSDTGSQAVGIVGLVAAAVLVIVR